MYNTQSWRVDTGVYVIIACDKNHNEKNKKEPNITDISARKFLYQGSVAGESWKEGGPDLPNIYGRNDVY